MVAPALIWTGVSLAADILFSRFGSRFIKSPIQRYFVKKAIKKAAYGVSKSVLKSISAKGSPSAPIEKQNIEIFLKNLPISQPPVSWTRTTTSDLEEEKRKMIKKAEEEKLLEEKYALTTKAKYYQPSIVLPPSGEIESLPSGGLIITKPSGEKYVVEEIPEHGIVEYTIPPPPPPPPEDYSFFTAGKPKPRRRGCIRGKNLAKVIHSAQEYTRHRGYTIGKCDYVLGYETQKWGYQWR